MTRTTASYSAVWRPGDMESDAEQRARETPVQDVFDDAGVFAGRVVWRAELNSWCGADAAHHIPLRRGTYEGAKRLILKRCACSTRMEAKGIR